MEPDTDEARDVPEDARGPGDGVRPTGRRVPRVLALAVPIAAVVAVVAVVAGSVLAGGGDDGGSDGDEPAPALVPGAAIVDEPSGLEPLSLSPDPLWGTDAGGPMAVVSAAVFRDDVAVLLGGDDDSPASRVAVVDAATGTPRWSIGQLDELAGGDGAVWWTASDSPISPNVVDRPGGWAVLVPYYYSPCPSWCHYTQVDRTEEMGVAALSADDGHVLWKTPVVPSVPMTDPPPATPTIRAMVTGEDLALVVVEPGDIEYAPSAGDYVDALRVIAVDPASGSILWEVGGVRPVAVVGDTVLARVGDDVVRTALGEDDQLEGPALVALDAATGGTRWDLTDSYRYSGLVFAVGDVALVEVPADDADRSIGEATVQGIETVVIDVETGDEATNLGSEVGPCRTDGTFLVACPVSDPNDRRGGERVATFRPDDLSVGVSEARFDGLSIDDVWDGRVVVAAFDPPQPDIPDYPRTDGMGAEEAAAARAAYREEQERYESWTPVERRWSVDPSGRSVDDSVPGHVLAASDRYAIFACGSIGDPCEGETEGEGLYDRYTVYALE